MTSMVTSPPMTAEAVVLTTIISVREVPRKLWKQVRTAALAHDQTAQEAVVEALTDYVAKKGDE